MRHPWSELLHTQKTEIRAFYEAMIPDIKQIARECGYAACVHGSLVRDLDVFMAPWVWDAEPQIHVVSRIIEELVSPCPIKEAAEQFYMGAFIPGHKPHGRTAYTIMAGYHLFIDVSFMPMLDIP